MNLKACIQQTWIVTLLCVGHCFCAVTLTQSSTNVDKGSSLNIIATFDEASLTWTYKGGTPLSTCSLALNACFPSQVENMMFTASSTTNTSTLSIASLNCSINTAVYVASTDSLLTDTVNIDVTTPVSSRVSTTVLTASKVQSQDLLVEVKCVYPRSTITANFTISRSGKPDDILFPDSIQTSTSSSGCECFEDTYVVKKTITALQYPNEVVQVQANIGQLSPLVIGDVNFTAAKSPDSPESSKVEIIAGVSGTIVVVITIIPVMILVYKKYSRKEQRTQGTHFALPAPKTPVGKDNQVVKPSQKTPVRTDNQLEQSRPDDEPQIDYPKGMPLKPEGQLKIKTKQDYVEFQWKPPKSNGGSHITEYIVDVHGINFGTWATFATSSKTKLQVPIEKFKNDEVMSFRVRAKNENGSSEPLLAQKPFTLQNSHDLLSDRPVATNQGRGHEGFLPRNSVGTEHKESSLLEKVPIDRTLPKPV